MLKRIIPVLLISDRQLVKTRCFEKPTYVGDPINAVKIFSEKEADELIVLDIEASKKGCEPDFEFIQDVASEARLPFAYGGGVTSLSMIERILRNGVEKIVFNFPYLQDPNLVRDAVREFGASTISLCLNIKKNMWGRYRPYSYTEGTPLKDDFETFLRKASAIGCGEYIIQSVDADGVMGGYDAKLMQQVRPFFTTPLVALGGAKDLDDMGEILKKGADAAAAGSLFVFYGKYRAVLITYPTYEERKGLVE